MKRAIATLLIVIAVSAAAQPSAAQDELSGRCEVPDFEEALSTARAAQAAGDEIAFLDTLSEIAAMSEAVYQGCLRSADLQQILSQQELYFKNADLSGADLRGTDLQGAVLSGANLQGADLEGVSLQGAYFNAANLQGIDLHDANLQEATLRDTNLQGADLHDANLQGAAFGESANLGGTNLRGANLEGTRFGDAIFDETTIIPDGTTWAPETDLTQFTDPAHPHFWRGFALQEEDLGGVDFSNANLRGAALIRANLSGTDLRGANLEGARLGGAAFDETTTLPDGTAWAPNTDLACFTDSQHPDFWRSDDPESPAYRGNDGE